MIKLSAFATSPPKSENGEEPLDAHHPEGGRIFCIRVRLSAPGNMAKDSSIVTQMGARYLAEYFLSGSDYPPLPPNRLTTSAPVNHMGAKLLVGHFVQRPDNHPLPPPPPQKSTKYLAARQSDYLAQV
jgi:hypothetical protein